MPETIEISLTDHGEVSSAERKTFLESIPYYLGGVYNAEFTANTLVIRDVPAGAVDSITQAARECLATAVAEHDRFEEKCVSSFTGDFALRENTYEELLARGDVMPSQVGKASYAGDMVKIFRALDEFISAQCIAMGAGTEIYPSALEGSSLLRAGYFNTFAQHTYFMAPLKTSRPALGAAADGSILSDEDGSAAEHLQTPEWVFSPTVCHHCFESRKDSAIELPLKITALNQCSRYEVHGTRSLERLRFYWMREFVHFDSDEAAVVASLDSFLDFMVETLTRWGITHEIVTASDPFFADSATSKRVFQNLFALKRELKLPIPGGSLACASFNNHQASLVQSFAVAAAGEDEDSSISSGCVAWGYDRLLFALLVQLGTVVDEWPQVIRDDLGI
ncbi:MAG: hypothetical protein Hals2KO_27760 [Halioglobus sp.]